MFNKISLIGLYVLLLALGGMQLYSLMYKQEKRTRYKVVETEISRIDTVYTTPPGILKLDLGLIDTTWDGNDVGIKVFDRRIYSTAEFGLVIACIDGFQYYICSGQRDCITPRVMNGPNGAIAVPCEASQADNPAPEGE